MMYLITCFLAIMALYLSVKDASLDWMDTYGKCASIYLNNDTLICPKVAPYMSVGGKGCDLDLSYYGIEHLVGHIIQIKSDFFFEPYPNNSDQKIPFYHNSVLSISDKSQKVSLKLIRN